MKNEKRKNQYRIDYTYEERRKGLHSFPTLKNYNFVYANSKKEALKEFKETFVCHLLSVKAEQVSL